MARTFWKQKCRGHKTNGEPCPNWAMDHQTICHAHFGRTKKNKYAADVRRRITKAGRRVKTTEPVEDPYHELAQINGRYVALQDVLWMKVESGDFEKADVDAWLKTAADAGKGLDTQGKAALDEKRLLIRGRGEQQLAAAFKHAWHYMADKLKHELPTPVHHTIDRAIEEHTRDAVEYGVDQTRQALDHTEKPEARPRTSVRELPAG